jgi:hypothetical protein
VNGLHLRLVYLLVIVNVAVHFDDQDLTNWIPLLGLVFVGWRWIGDHVRIPVPGRWIAALFASVASVGIWAEFGNLIGDPASTALLCVMVSLKTFEIRGYRDLMIVTYLCLLLLMSKLLNSQSIGMTVFMIVDIIAVISLMHLYHVPKINRGLPWRRAVKLVLQAAPVIAALFMLFPRFNFSLFKRPDQPSARVGFSGQLRPGGVAELAQSNEIAFRAFFKGTYIPPMTKLYWRGAVLTKADGLNWDPNTARVKGSLAVQEENPIEIMIESAGSSWVFTMDWPQGVVMNSQARQRDVQRAPGLAFALQAPLQERETYRVSFVPTSREASFSDEEVELASEAAAPSKLLKPIVDEWKAKRPSAAGAVGLIRDYYSANKFSYTLTPPETSDLDEFLFFTKRGFCEHFAGATASLLRMMGVPARVIVGYHGGAMSLMGDYLIVSQRDAHAWVEYWDGSKATWVRVDPTTWVADERIAMGGQRYFESINPEASAGFQGVLLSQVFGVEILQWLTRGRLLVDQAEIAWVTFLLRFDINYQREMFAKLGWNRISTWSLFVLSLLAVAVVLVAATVVMRNRIRPRKDSGQYLYGQLCQKLAGAGLERQFTEGPVDLARRAIARWPERRVELAEVFDRLIRVRYGQSTHIERDLAEIRRSIKTLNVVNAPGRR